MVHIERVNLIPIYKARHKIKKTPHYALILLNTLIKITSIHMHTEKLKNVIHT